MSRDPELESRFAQFVEHHVLRGVRLPVDALCEDRPDLVAPLEALVAAYFDVSETLDEPQEPALAALELPQFEGFRTVERLGAGGMGEVFKLEDPRLKRFVAAKVMRRDRGATAALARFLEEARSMALFQDRRIVQIFEFRTESDPPVIIMEHVDGFELGQVAPSLEFRQRARIVEEVADAIHLAHQRGLQHRDLKPSNIMVDHALAPRILDFGLSAGDPDRGHLQGTVPYLAPEQLDPGLPIDARTDVYALGVVLYESLTASLPYCGTSDQETIAAIRAGRPRLPAEIDPGVPEPLQAIALKAMERDPDARYQSARDMALDLRRYRDGRPVLARPTLYAAALETRVRPHLAQIAEWRRQRLIYPHEAARLEAAYQELEVREDDWLLSGRALSYSQIALYLGAFLLVAGSLFYFGAHRFHEAVAGVARPFAVLGLPFLGLNLTARHLEARNHRIVAVAFYLAGVTLLPLFLLILFHETGLWVVPDGAAGQIVPDGSVSNRQLQVTTFVACLWAGALALRTRTTTLSTVFTVVVFLFVMALLGDFGLRAWIDEGQYDRLALHLLPLVALYAVLGAGQEWAERSWFGRPLYIGAALTFVLALELLALQGKAFEYLGLSMQRFHTGEVTNPVLLDTLTAMTLNGILMYGAGSLVARHGSTAMGRAAALLFVLSPFAALKPLGYLSMTGEYARTFDWIYLGLSFAACLLSHARQRRSFYYAGLINAGWALWEIADHYDWFDRPAWAIVLVSVGLAVLALGFLLETRRIRDRGSGNRDQG